MKKKLLILAGGFSREREISLKTAKAVFKEIKNIYTTKISEPDGNLVATLRKFKPDFVFNALHGRYGEDGYIQSILESEKIKYTHSGVLPLVYPTFLYQYHSVSCPVETVPRYLQTLFQPSRTAH